MEDITKVYLTDYIPTIYTTPCTMYYQQNGRLRKYDIFAERNGVIIVVYNRKRNVLVLVKQFRPVVYLHSIPVTDRHNINLVKYPPKLGITLEFCAGLEDQIGLTSKEIARNEIYEECGYKIDNLEQIELIGTIKNLTETTGARSIWYYCEVDDTQKVNNGGGIDDEIIEVIEMGVDDVLNYIQQDYVGKTAHFMAGFYWFLYNKYQSTLRH